MPDKVENRKRQSPEQAEFIEAYENFRLNEFLRNQAYTHGECYYQYTSMGALDGMLKSGVIHLSRARELNDLNELEKFRTDDWDRVYIASFTYRRSENMAMWGLYGEPFSDAVRLHFPFSRLQKMINIGRECGAHLVQKVDGVWVTEAECLPIKVLGLTDVAYKARNSLQWRSYTVKIGDSFDYHIRKDGLMGRIKGSAWNYESEVRLIVELDASVDLDLLPRRIGLSYGDDLLSDIGILCGPCNTRERVLRRFGDIPLKRKRGGDAIRESHYCGQVHIQSRCERCDLSDAVQRSDCPLRQRWPFVV